MKTKILFARIFSSATVILGMLALSEAFGGSLVIDGDLNVQNSLILSGSSATSSTPSIINGLSVCYSDGTSGADASITQVAARQFAVWNWQRQLGTGSTGMVMQIDSNNCLILSGTGTNKIILDPNSGVNANGSALLTQSMANSFYLPANAGLYASNGAVGIGTNSPQAALDVSGNVRFDNGTITTDGSGTLNTRAINATGSASFGGNLNVTGQLMVSNAAGGTGAKRLVLDQTDGTGQSAVLEFRNGATRMYWFLDGVNGANGGSHGQIRTDSSKNILLQSNQSSSGGVGIGAYAAVNAKLHVLGYTASTPVAIFQGVASQSGDLTQWKNSAGTVLSTVNKDGSLGINTATPQAALDVNGDARISGSLTISSSGALRVASGLVVTGTLDSTNTVVSSGTGRLLLIPQQGDLLMGTYTVGIKPQ